jgi:hypothetical protein
MRLLDTTRATVESTADEVCAWALEAERPGDAVP